MTPKAVSRRQVLAGAGSALTATATGAAAHLHQTTTLPLSITIADATTETAGGRTWITRLDVVLEHSGGQSATVGAWTWHEHRTKYVYWPAVGTTDGTVVVTPGSLTTAAVQTAHPRGRLPEGVQASLVVMTLDGNQRAATTIDTTTLLSETGQ